MREILQCKVEFFVFLDDCDGLGSAADVVAHVKLLDDFVEVLGLKLSRLAVPDQICTFVVLLVQDIVDPVLGVFVLQQVYRLLNCIHEFSLEKVSVDADRVYFVLVGERSD